MTTGKTAVALAAALSLGSCAKTNGWSNAQPAYNARQNCPTLRVEGGSKLSDKVSCYAFMDADAVEEDTAELESFYGEARIAYALNDSWALAAEYGSGNSCEDSVRFGLVWTPKTGKGNLTMFKIYPVETSGHKGPQVCGYTLQEFTDRVSACITFEYNIDPKTLYVEAEVDFRLKEQLALFLQARGFGSIEDKIEFAPVVGLKCDF